MKAKLSLFLFLSLCGSALAQQALTVEEAIALSLEKNLSIKISEKTAEISANDYEMSKWALLPNIDVTASKSYSETDVTQQLASSSEIRTIDNAKTNNLNISPSLRWTIFDGLGMFKTRDRLKLIENLGEDDLRIQIENNIALVSSAYYRVVLENERLRVFQDALELSRQRLDLAKTTYEVGKASKLTYLQAQVDFNSDSSNLLSQKELIFNVKIDLNRLIGESLDNDYEVDAEFAFDKELVLAALLKSAQSNNPSLIRAQRNREVNYLQIKQINAERYPVLSLNLGYTYNDRNSDAGAVLSNTSSGINYGASASFRIFNGFDIKRREQNAKIQVEVSELQIEDLKQALEVDIRKTYVNYQNSLKLNELEAANLEVAKENYDIALERFKVGNSNTVELREAQVSLVQAEIRRLTSLFNIKLAEIELIRLAGYNLQ